MSEADLLLRVAAFALLGLSLVLARSFGGRGVDNVAFWNGAGMFALYTCYCLSGVRFANGTSAAAELVVAAMVALGIFAFLGGLRFSDARSRRLGAQAIKRRDRANLCRVAQRILPKGYLWAQCALSIVFYALLTRGQPWRLLTDGVGLKVERLEGIAEKSPLLLNLDALVFAMTLIGLAWAIFAYCDNRPSRVRLGISLALMSLYVLSTGSRSPLIAVLLQVLPAVAIARIRSKDMAWIANRKWLFVLVLAAGIVFMILTTGARIEFEDLSDYVFRVYFRIDDFGLIEPLLRSGNAAAFFASTAATYAASTYNNIIIRWQELAVVSPSMGYRFVFFYLSATQLLLGDLAPAAAAQWRDLATLNNDHLSSISQAAGQWATPYGDLLWDFGVAMSFALVAIVGALVGIVIGRARRHPTFANISLKVFVVGFLLSPLVNPLLSLYVHYGLAIIIGMNLRASTRGRLVITRRLRRRRRPAASPAVVAKAT